jgi:lysophospholipase
MRRLPLCAFLALTGCATVQPCLSPPPVVTPAHADLTVSAFQHQGAEQTCLQAFEWKPKAAPRAVLLIVHGIRDHALRYQPLAEAVAEQGFVVYAQDMRGHGHSGGPRQRWETLTELRDDVDLLIAEAKQRNPGLPLFVYGHSMGGLVSTDVALEHPELAGLVLSGAALKLLPDVTSGQQTAARFFGAIAPGLKAQHLDDSLFVRDPAVRAAFAADPLVVHDDLPARSAAATLNGIEAVHARSAELKLPLLVMHGTVDHATNPEGSQELVQRAASTDKTLKLWDGVYHDLLNEPEGPQVIALVTTWLVAHLPPR